jgi:hypothetical protein
MSEANRLMATLPPGVRRPSVGHELQDLLSRADRPALDDDHVLRVEGVATRLRVEEAHLDAFVVPPPV